MLGFGFGLGPIAARASTGSAVPPTVVTLFGTPIKVPLGLNDAGHYITTPQGYLPA